MVVGNAKVFPHLQLLLQDGSQDFYPSVVGTSFHLVGTTGKGEKVGRKACFLEAVQEVLPAEVLVGALF